MVDKPRNGECDSRHRVTEVYARLKLPDAIQAAMALEHQLTLVTRNTRDFKPGGVPGVLIPYSI